MQAAVGGEATRQERTGKKRQSGGYGPAVAAAGRAAARLLPLVMSPSAGMELARCAHTTRTRTHASTRTHTHARTPAVRMSDTAAGRTSLR